VREKIANVLGTIYGYSITLCLAVGAFAGLCFIAALVVGLPVSEKICDFAWNVLQILVYFSNITLVLGLIKMYVAGEKGMVVVGDNSQEEDYEELDD